MKNAQITIVGLGLMGGSLAMRLKAGGTCRRVTALLRREEAVVEAQRLGVVDQASTNPAQALAEADIVIFSTPVRILIKQLAQYAPFFKPGAVITDMGSSKAEICAVMNDLPANVYPVGSHPMCGKEISGLAAAEPELYEGATWVISPLERTPSAAIALIDELARSLGAKPLLIEAHRHDKLAATISHMPYVLSSALVLAAQTVGQHDETLWQIAASGFRDTSRIAASDVTMMLDILLTNQTAVVEMLGRLQQELTELAEAISAGDEDALQEKFQQARKQRRALY